MFDGSCRGIVIPVNCVGVPGAGVAKVFAQRWPLAARIYKDLCANSELEPGVVRSVAEGGHVFFLFPTKTTWRTSSELAHVVEGLPALTREMHQRQVASVAVPALGCGLGGLDWGAVEPLLAAWAKFQSETCGVRVHVHAPRDEA